MNNTSRLVAYVRAEVKQQYKDTTEIEFLHVEELRIFAQHYFNSLDDNTVPCELRLIDDYTFNAENLSNDKGGKQWSK
jgi:hypothetical protein